MSMRHLRNGLVISALPAGLLCACAKPEESFQLDPSAIIGVTASEDDGPATDPVSRRLSSPAAKPAFVESLAPPETPEAEALDTSLDVPLAEVLAPPDAAVPETPGTAQRVFLDFDGGVPSFEVILENVDGSSSVLRSFPSHAYTPDERAAIEALVAADVSTFGVSVSRVPPVEGAFSTLTFNAPLPIRLVAVAGGGFLVNGSFGDSDAIDHRNRNPADSAVIAAHLWEFFVLTDPSGRSFSAASGLAVDAEHPLAARLSEAVVQQSANTAAHELGHLLGLRHHDGFGPLGSGLPNPSSTGEDLPSPLEFVPPFPGPLEASETTLHLMSTGRTGATPRVRASVDQFFSERSATKMTVARELSPVPEAEAQRAALEPVRLRVPNTVLAGVGADRAELDVQTLLLAANISAVGEVDEFRFVGRAGDVWTVDLESASDPSFTNPVVADLRLFFEEPGGARELVAFNAQIFEGNDPLLLDVELPRNGTYVVQIEAPDTAFIDSDGDGFRDDPISLEENGLGDLRTGDYELLLYSVAP